MGTQRSRTLGRRVKGRWLVIGVLATGLGASLFAAIAVWKIERLLVEGAFERAAINRAAAVRRGLGHGTDVLEAAGALIAASDVVTREQFRAFVDPLLAGHPTVRALAWAPRISAAERSSYEGESGRRLAVSEADGRSESFPVLYLEPLSGNEHTLGIDLSSHPELAAVMRRARETGRITASARTTLARGSTDPDSLLVFLPVYRRIPTAVPGSAGRQSLLGFAVVVHRIDQLIGRSLSLPQPVGIDVVVSDESAPEGERVLHVHSSRLRGDLLPRAPPPASFAEATLRHRTDIPFAGRTWSVALTPAPGFFELPTRRDPEIALALGLSLTGLLTGASWLLWRRSVDLERSNQKLNLEIGERTRLEENLELFQSLMHHSAEAIFVIDPPSARLLYVNEQAAQQLGYSTDELLELTVLDIAEEGPYGRTFEDWQRWVASLERSPARVVEARHRRKDRKIFPVELSVSLVVSRGRQFLVAIAEDISVRRSKEKAVTLIHDRLLQLSSVDGLTGVANRRVFDERLSLEWRRAARDRSPLSLIISDIDHFKLFNDYYGHLAGDDCLKKIAGTFTAGVSRPADLVARFGGEELVVLLPETTAEGAYEIAERLRTAVEALAIPHDGSPIRPTVTVSLGVGTVVPAPDSRVEPFLQAVDEALYRSKDLGRNRTERAA